MHLWESSESEDLESLPKVSSSLSSAGSESEELSSQEASVFALT